MKKTVEHNPPLDLNFPLERKHILNRFSLPNTVFSPLLVCDKKEKLLFLLNSKPHLPYQKPALPCCKKDPSLHHILRCLKTAQTFLFLQTQALEELLPRKLPHVLLAYSYNIKHGHLPTPQAFQVWCQETRGSLPLLIEGISLEDDTGRTCHLDLNLSLHPLSLFDYSKTLPIHVLEPLRLAIVSYNESIAECFAHGLDIIPFYILDELAGLLPPTKPLKEYDI